MEEKPVSALGLKTESFLNVWGRSFKTLKKNAPLHP